MGCCKITSGIWNSVIYDNEFRGGSLVREESLESGLTRGGPVSPGVSTAQPGLTPWAPTYKLGLPPLPRYRVVAEGSAERFRQVVGQRHPVVCGKPGMGGSLVPDVDGDFLIDPNVLVTRVEVAPKQRFRS